MINKWFQSEMGQIKVTEIEYHRNGIAGNGFNIVKFILKQGNKNQNMIAIVFDEKGYCAVFDSDLLATGNIKFGENSWRGDSFEEYLRREIDLFYEDDIEPDSYDWEAEANSLARTFVGEIYPCNNCGHPVLEGYSCTYCKNSDPC